MTSFMEFMSCDYNKISSTDPEQLKPFLEKFIAKEDAERAEEKRDTYAMFGIQPSQELPEIQYMGAVSSKAYGDNAEVEERATFPGTEELGAWDGEFDGPLPETEKEILLPLLREGKPKGM